MIIVFSILFLIVISIIIYLQWLDQKLLETVTRSYRGTKSEREMVLTLLKSGIPKQTIFHDLYVKNYGENYSQIDLVLATKVGIIVFEVKKYSGWIYGTGYKTNWTQVLAYGRQKHQFYNPFIQNKRHIEVLKKQLSQFESIPFYSVIVFYGDCTFKDISAIPNGTFLIKSSRVLDVIKKIELENEPVQYTDKREVVTLLKSSVRNGESQQIINQHIKNIKEILSKDKLNG